MTVEIFLILLTILSTTTGLLTEFMKKLLDSMNKNYITNILALIVSIIVGGAGTSVYYILNGYEWNLINIVCIFLMMIANCLGAMLGYDKVKQTILQLSR